MKTLKDKRKFGWNKQPKNRNCKKFGIQGRLLRNRNVLHMLLFHTEGWKEKTREINLVVNDIKYYYSLYVDNKDIFEYVVKYENKSFWKSTNGRYYKTLYKHIKELYNTIKLREDI